MKVKSNFLIAFIAIQITSSCQNRQDWKSQQDEQSYYRWVCLQGKHQGTEIVLAHIGNVFCGEYTDQGFQNPIIIAIMGMIDDSRWRVSSK